MSNDLLNSVLGALGPNAIESIAGKLGVRPDQARGAVAAALPLLLGALGKNASQPGGAAALHAAVEKRHAGLDLQQVLGQALGGQGQGGAIVQHMLGNRQAVAAAGIGQASGLGQEKAGDLMAMLAPMIMAAIGQKTGSAGLNTQGLAGLLGQQKQTLSGQGGIASQLMGAVLDKDGDGDVDLADIMAVAQGASGKGSAQGGLGGLLGGLFGKN